MALYITLSVIGGVILLLVVAYCGLLLKNPNRHRPQKIENADGYVKAVGTNIYDGEGYLLQLRGVNVGNWLVQEYWMAVSGIGDFDTGIYTHRRGEAAMRANPNLTEADIEDLHRTYLDNYITEEDFATISSLGLNTVRIPFTYMNLTRDGELKEDAFHYLDWAVAMCKKYNLYAILDMHGAFGSQNMDIHSGDDENFALYGNAENEERTIALWRTIATRYRDNKTVAAYDLLNEPRRAKHKFGGKINFRFYDRIYRAVREIDNRHMILIECFSFPFNGARMNGFNWENVAIEYHIYNLMATSQKTCLNFYKATHNLMGFKVPVYIGEWNAWGKRKDWELTLDFYDKLGWSYTSWTYKTNKYIYKNGKKKNINSWGIMSTWGIFELDTKPVDISTATKAEISAVYKSAHTSNATPSLIYNLYKERFAGDSQGEAKPRSAKNK